MNLNLIFQINHGKSIFQQEVLCFRSVVLMLWSIDQHISTIWKSARNANTWASPQVH